MIDIKENIDKGVYKSSQALWNAMHEARIALRQARTEKQKQKADQKAQKTRDAYYAAVAEMDKKFFTDAMEYTGWDSAKEDLQHRVFDKAWADRHSEGRYAVVEELEELHEVFFGG